MYLDMKVGGGIVALIASLFQRSNGIHNFRNGGLGSAIWWEKG